MRSLLSLPSLHTTLTALQSQHTIELRERAVTISLKLPDGTTKEVELDHTVPIEQVRASIAEQTGLRMQKVRAVMCPGLGG